MRSLFTTFKMIVAFIVIALIVAFFIIINGGGKSNCTHTYMFKDGPHEVPCGSALDDVERGLNK